MAKLGRPKKQYKTPLEPDSVDNTLETLLDTIAREAERIAGISETEELSAKDQKALPEYVKTLLLVQKFRREAGATEELKKLSHGDLVELAKEAEKFIKDMEDKGVTERL